MKSISGQNVDEGVRAAASFIGLFYRMLTDNRIFNHQTAFLPQELNWIEYLTVNVADECAPDVDQSLLRLGAMVATVSWLDDAFSEEFFGEKCAIAIHELRNSEFGTLPEVAAFLRELDDPESYSGAENTLDAIYRKFVRTWWESQLSA